jgi:hypothetical protein
MRTITLPAGTTVIVNGIPVALKADTEVETDEGNIELLSKPPAQEAPK